METRDPGQSTGAGAISSSTGGSEGTSGANGDENGKKEDFRVDAVARWRERVKGAPARTKFPLNCFPSAYFVTARTL